MRLSKFLSLIVGASADTQTQDDGLTAFCWDNDSPTCITYRKKKAPAVDRGFLSI
jgi:hypothetical protein